MCLQDPETVLVSALNTWFASVMGAATFHADVHAGQCLLVLFVARVRLQPGPLPPEHWPRLEPP